MLSSWLDNNLGSSILDYFDSIFQSILIDFPLWSAIQTTVGFWNSYEFSGKNLSIKKVPFSSLVGETIEIIPQDILD